MDMAWTSIVVRHRLQARDSSKIIWKAMIEVNTCWNKYSDEKQQVNNW
jgi:hypothetical protein